MTTTAILYNRIANHRARVVADAALPPHKRTILLKILDNAIQDLADYMVGYEDVRREGLAFLLDDRHLDGDV